MSVVEDYKLLLHSLVNVCTKMADGSHKKKWDGELSKVAKQLLHYHALINNVDEVHQVSV